jgi:hypothetical protein
MLALQDLGRRTRQLRNLVEPIAAAVFFAPEAQDAYSRLGFPSPQGTEDGIPLFDWGAYFVSRAAIGEDFDDMPGWSSWIHVRSHGHVHPSPGAPLWRVAVLVPQA